MLCSSDLLARFGSLEYVPFLRAIAAQDRDFLCYDENVLSISNTLW